MRCAFHVHTCFSSDCRMSLEGIIEVCISKKIDAVIITDHNTIRGAVALKNIAANKLEIIIGEEIKTNEGELLGLFIEEEIAPYNSPERTIKEIREQNGLVCVPHPFDFFRNGKIKETALKRIIDEIDIIEVFNSRNIFNFGNKKALQFAKSIKKTQIFGSDAHTKNEIGNAIIEMKPFSSKEEFLLNLENANKQTKRSSTFVHLTTKYIKLSNVLIK